MTAGSSDKMRRMIAGLLVLAVLLVSGAQALVAMVPHSHHHDGGVAGQAIAVAGYDLTTPVHDDDCDHGLPCCIGGQCAVHAYCIAAEAAALPARPRLAVAVVPMPQLSLPGIVIRPSAPRLEPPSDQPRMSRGLLGP